MRFYHWITAICITALVTTIGTLGAIPVVFANRVSANVYLGPEALIGLPAETLPNVIARYEESLLQQPTEIILRDKKITRALHELGVTVDHELTQAAIIEHMTANPRWQASSIAPILNVDQEKITEVVKAEFANYLTLPTNASLSISPAGISTVTPSTIGENIDLTTLAADMQWRARHNSWSQPIELRVVSTPPSVHEGEVAGAITHTEALLRDGITLSDGVTQWRLEGATIRQLLRFSPTPDPAQAENYILGVTIDNEAARRYLNETIAPAINQPAIDARFERTADRVTQFAIPQAGRTLNVDASITALQQAVATNAASTQLVIDTLEPTVRDVADITTLGIANLLAVGTSDFAGSPNNRRHNITEGVKRYHGLLIAPNQEFSFNEFLGPVDGTHGFKPELVIKHDKTIPEFGGGLCQVSTTMFRAATNAGLKITARRNHAYAVTYYGTPGFDATIYPPYTDLRFTNNTPSYILVQARIEGTKLTFELWGTDDQREVVVTGPHPYGRTPDGAVKATLTQKVTRGSDTIIDETFYSNYRSPNLFPKPNANPTPPPVGGPSPSPTPST